MNESQSVFTVVQSAFSAQSVLPFTSTVFNIGGGVNSTANKIVVPRCGLYWTHLEIKTIATSMLADFSLISTTTPPIGVLKNGTSASDYLILSRQDLRWIPGGTEMYTSSPTYGGQYWFLEGFNIAGLMDPLIAFNVYNNLTITAPALPQPFSFNNVLVNEGGGWNSSSYTFKAPKSGTYVLSYTTACTANVITSFYLYLNSTLILNAEVSDTTHTGIDMATRCVVIDLYKGQSIWISGSGTQSYGEKYQLSSFKGFLVSPLHGIMCAWSIYSPSPGTDWKTLLNVGIFNITLDPSLTNAAYVTIPNDGIYFVSITTTNNNAASAGNFRVHINATGTYPYPEIFTRQGAVGCATRSSSSLLRLRNNNTVIAKSPSGSSWKAYATFGGFLLYPL